MEKVKYHIPQFIMGILFGLLIVVAMIYLFWIGDKIDKIYTFLDVNATCESIHN